MKRLVYCVIRDPELAQVHPPPGLGGEPVLILREGEIGAAWSCVDAPKSTLTPREAKVYANVVHACYEHRTVLPVRYGWLLANEEDVREALRGRQEQFLGKLREVDGCAEMGVRVLLTPLGSVASDSRGAAQAATGGRAYLSELKTRYAERDCFLGDFRAEAETVCRGLAGLFARARWERTRLRDQEILSLFFLVPKVGVGSFAAAFNLYRTGAARAMWITGPWPPYSFVSFDDEPAHAATRNV